MTSQSENKEQVRVRSMLRSIKVGDRVKATVHAPAFRVGQTGTVTDIDPFYGDGIRRVRVQWDNGDNVSVLPRTVEIDR